MPKMQLALIGAGNLAWNLAARLQGTDFEIVQVFSRHLDSASRLSKAFPSIQTGLAPSQLRQDLDLVIVASSDHGIAEIAQAYAVHRGAQTAFVHTSGSVHVDVLAPFGERIGVFYPLQTFTKAHPADFAGIPIFLEGNAEVLARLQPLAQLLSQNVRLLDSAQRLQLHMGAVFASNFANFMWLMADDVLKGIGQENMDFFAPLMRECLEKALRYGPLAAQTGPARRGDAVTMQKHLQLLGEGDPQKAELYEIVSKMIGTRFGADGAGE
jgi:predicted short-subunit dehydrogenase-like oxidoreductase (DUF2520 family)